jgi:spore germination protein YaaH
MNYLKVIISSIIAGLLLPVYALAAAETFEVSAWIPYWRTEKGVSSILPNISTFTEVNPFVYTVKTNGELHQATSIRSADWKALKAASEKEGVRFIPTVMWASSDLIDETLRNPAKRQAHIRSIAREVFKYDFDGIDIDYEAKYAKTRPFFSLFLKELDEAIGYNKWIMCTIESRTPLEARYSSPESIPDDIEYANDFTEINKYCDRVRVMAYDQGRIDLQLNKEREHPYIPVADVAWVEKAMRLAMEDIDADKLVLGVPTYGYEWDMFAYKDDQEDIRYSKLWSFNPGYATELATKLGLTPTRNSSGELMLTFTASLSPEPSIPLPNATRILTWSDAEAVKDKIELAQELGIRGVAVFKIDGGEDPKVWDIVNEFEGSEISKTAEKAPDIELAQRIVDERINLPLPEIDLEYGDRREEVKMLQAFLNAAGFAVSPSGPGSLGNETTFFGPATEAALIKFQKAHAVWPSVGYFGPKTRSTMGAL